MQGRAEEPLFLELVARSWGFSWRFRGVFVGFSWLQIIAIEASSHSWPVFVGYFRGIFVDPLPKGPFRTKNAIAMEIVVFCYCGSILLSVPIRCHFS